MKKLSIVVVLLAASSTSFSQINLNKLTLQLGFGIQQYSGDLGNGFYDFSQTTYGVGIISLNYELNNSFDLKVMNTIGDLGYCQPEWKKEFFAMNRPHVDGEAHIHGKLPEEENLNSRMVSGIVGMKYKFANDYLLPTSSYLKPYVYLAAGINRITDIMKMKCVNPGNYVSVNWGTGFDCEVFKRIDVGASFSFGKFSSDALDFVKEGGNDMYMQNSILLGFKL